MKNSVYVLFLFLMITLIGCNQKRIEVANVSFSALNEEMLKKDQIRSLYNEGKSLYENEKLINSKGDTVLLEDINRNTSLIIRYSGYSCSDCITFVNRSVLDSIKNKEDVFIFMADVPIRDLHVIKQQLGLDNIYRVDSLPIYFDEEKIPYMFVLDSDHVISSFFIPRKEMPEQMNTYLNFVNNILSSYPE